MASVTTNSDSETVNGAFQEEDRVEVVHPLFVIPYSAAENMRSWFERDSIVFI